MISAAAILCCIVVFAGCSTTSVTSIEYTSTSGKTDTYTVYYSDGTTSTFEVTNGSDVTVEDLYGYYCEL